MISLKADMNSYKKDANETRIEGSGDDVLTELTFILNLLYSIDKVLLLAALQAFQKLNNKKSFDDFFKEIEKRKKEMGDDDAQS